MTALAEAIKKISHDSLPDVCNAEVVSVNTNNNTCVVKVLKTDVVLPDVVLLSIEMAATKTIVVYPKVGSIVTVAFFGKTNDSAMVINTTDAENISIGGSEFGGIVKADVLKEEADKLRDYVASLKAATKTALVAIDALLPGTSAAFEAAMLGKTTGDFSGIKNNRVKHG